MAVESPALSALLSSKLEEQHDAVQSWLPTVGCCRLPPVCYRLFPTLLAAAQVQWFVLNVKAQWHTLAGTKKLSMNDRDHLEALAKSLLCVATRHYATVRSSVLRTLACWLTNCIAIDAVYGQHN